MFICSMRSHLRAILIILSFLFCGYSYSETPVYDFSYFQKRVQQKNDTLYVVNFWATWCKPCVEELPYFQKAFQAFQSQPVKIILVSMDMKKQGVQVQEFLNKK